MGCRCRAKGFRVQGSGCRVGSRATFLPNNAAAVVVEHSERRRRSADDDHDDDGADDGADGVERRKGVQRCKVCRALIRMAWLSTS